MLPFSVSILEHLALKAHLYDSNSWLKNSGKINLIVHHSRRHQTALDQHVNIFSVTVQKLYNTALSEPAKLVKLSVSIYWTCGLIKTIQN